MFLAPYAARVGWRQACVVLAIVVAFAVPIVGLLMSRSPIESSHGHVRRDSGDSLLGGVLSDRIFWILLGSFSLIPMAVGGLQLHLLAFLADANIDPIEAGRIASLTGAFLIVGRIGVGWLVDRIFAPLVAAVAMIISALAIAAVAIIGAKAAPLGAVAVGLSNGAEIDLIGYLTARYFGTPAYGRIYGLLYAAYLLSASLSVVFYGWIFDSMGSYAVAVRAAPAFLIASAALFLTLPPYRAMAKSEALGQDEDSRAEATEPRKTVEYVIVGGRNG